MKKELKRRYIYDKTFNEIIDWVEREKRRGFLINPPNHKPNFPFYLHQYIKHLKFKNRILKIKIKNESKR